MIGGNHKLHTKANLLRMINMDPSEFIFLDLNIKIDNFHVLYVTEHNTDFFISNLYNIANFVMNLYKLLYSFDRFKLL